jgi:hypothetical protein
VYAARAVDPLQAAISYSGLVVRVFAFLGLVVSRRYRECYSFALYLPAVAVPQFLELAWPERFYRWDVWLVKEALHALLKFTIALEVSVRTFRAFPGALASARGVVFLVAVVTLVGIVTTPGPALEYTTAAGRVLPRALGGTAWLFLAVTALVLWYRLPVRPLQKAILIGFVPYLLAFTIVMNALDSFGWHLRTQANYLQAVVYWLITVYWAYAAWRPSKQPTK